MQSGSTVLVAALIGIMFGIGMLLFLVIRHARIARDLGPEERLRLRSWKRLKKAGIK
jgi:hypothetical protein